MKKILLGIKIVLLIIVGAALGIGVFSFVVAKTLYFPDIKQLADDSGAGLRLTAYQYEPWFWNKEKRTVININDWKNNADNFQTVIDGEVHRVKLMHSGEDFALVTYNDPGFSSLERGFVVRRSPKAESENTIETLSVGGHIIAVAPDESGYFYVTTSANKIFKRSWQGDTMLEVDLPFRMDPWVESSLLFFSNNTKMAFFGKPEGERDGFLFIWDLEKNEIDKISTLERFPGFSFLSVIDDMLYIETAKSGATSKRFIAE